MGKEKFNPGDIVQLKSGGPKMTVIKLEKYRLEPEEKALCAWFNDIQGKYESLAFTMDALNKVK